MFLLCRISFVLEVSTTYLKALIAQKLSPLVTVWTKILLVPKNTKSIFCALSKFIYHSSNFALAKAVAIIHFASLFASVL